MILVPYECVKLCIADSRDSHKIRNTRETQAQIQPHVDIKALYLHQSESSIETFLFIAQLEVQGRMSGG